jgi:hypothetical protein
LDVVAGERGKRYAVDHPPVGLVALFGVRRPSARYRLTVSPLTPTALRLETRGSTSPTQPNVVRSGVFATDSGAGMAGVSSE